MIKWATEFSKAIWQLDSSDPSEKNEIPVVRGEQSTPWSLDAGGSEDEDEEEPGCMNDSLKDRMTEDHWDFKHREHKAGKRMIGPE